MNENNMGMYDDNGKFVPFTSSSGNVDGDISFLRDTYLEAEKSYFLELLKDEKIYMQFCGLLNSSNDLYEEAIHIQEKLENGDLVTVEEKEQMKLMIPEEREKFYLKKLERAEGLMCLLFAAIRDKVKILEIVKVYSPGRTR